MRQSRLVDTVNKGDVTMDEVLAMIIAGKKPGEVSKEDIAKLHGEAPGTADAVSVGVGGPGRI